MSRLLPAALILLGAAAGTPALADECRGPEGIEPPSAMAPTADGEFRYVPGKGLGCAVPEQAALAMAANQRALTHLSCLKIGPVSVSDSMASVEQILGPPHRVLQLSETVESRAYYIGEPSLARAHYAVTYRKGEVVAVQLVGPAPARPLAMSSLNLGDPQARVVELFGPPAKRCPGPRSSESWLWPPLPMGVDIADGVVVAMKVTWPAR